MFQIINVKRVLLLSFFIFFSFLDVSAHNPSDSSTMLVEGDNNEWILILSSSLTAFQKEIEINYSADSYKTPEEFRELVIKHLSKNISIVCDDDKQLKIEGLAVKLGHSTKASFKVLEVPKDFTSIQVKNTSFVNLNRNKSALIILKKNIAKEQFILNEENKHTLNLQIKNAKFEIAINELKSQKNNLWWSLGGLLVLFLLFIGFKTKMKPLNI